MHADNPDALAVLANLETVFLAQGTNVDELPPLPGTADRVRPPLFGSWIANQLIGEIIRGDLPGGTPIREIELAQRFNTSRTPVREAIRALSGYGLLDAHTHRSHIVRTLTEQEAALISQARMAIEPPIARLAALHMDEPSREQIKALVPHFTAACEADDRYRFFALLARIATLKAMACRNPYLVSMYTTIAHNVARVRFLSVEDAEPLSEKMKRMERHMDALLNGDPDAAESAMFVSVTHSWKSLAERFGTGQNGPVPSTIEELAVQPRVNGVAERVSE